MYIEILTLLIMAATNISFANKVIDGNKAENTKNQYSSKISHFDEWFREKHPKLVDGSDPPILNLQEIGNSNNGTEALKEFYEHILRTTELKRSTESAARWGGAICNRLYSLYVGRKT